MYAMSCGERSSRQIEDRTRVDAAFRIASGNQFPDHSTLCRFRQRTGGEDGTLEDLFTKVLYVSAVAGLGRLQVISVDGYKIWATRRRRPTGPWRWLRKLYPQVLAEAAAADGNCGCESHGHGEAAGGCGCCAQGMLPGLRLEAGSAARRMGWRVPGGADRGRPGDLEAVREPEDAARRQQAEAYLAKARAGQAPPGRVPQEAAVTVAEIALEQATAVHRPGATRTTSGSRPPPAAACWSKQSETGVSSGSGGSGAYGLRCWRYQRD